MDPTITNYLLHTALPFIIYRLWPLWMIPIIIILYQIYIHLRNAYRIRHAGIKDLDRMNGSQFEAYLTWLFSRLGHRVENIGDTGDFGADLLTRYRGETYVIQAKCYSGSVGVEAIQQTVAARGFYATDHAWCVTNSYYTRAAKKLAAANHIILWDRDILIQKILQAKRT